ncbi:efflux RND transporter periplasmic adaptor subunit [bacterium]|nr:efflux RND transporter periplasmic adaptor subunit [bacterium]
MGKNDYIIISDRINENRKFYGIIKATQSTNLSFQTEGKIVFLPYTKGDFVKKGQIIARLDGALYSIKRNEEYAKLKEYIVQKQKQDRYYKRLDLLHKEGAISDNDWESAFYELKIIDQQISMQKEKINYIDKELSNNVIISPFDAYIAEKFMDIDSYAKVGVPIVAIIGVNSLQIEVMVDEYMINELSLGQKANILVQNQKYEGIIEHISKTSFNSGGYLIKIKILGNILNLKEGMRGDVIFSNNIEDKTVYLPLEALFQENGETYVLKIENVVNNVGEIKKVNVQIGEIIQDKISIIEGLKAGDYVIAKNVAQYEQKQKVKL